MHTWQKFTCCICSPFMRAAAAAMHAVASLQCTSVPGGTSDGNTRMRWSGPNVSVCTAWMRAATAAALDGMVAIAQHCVSRCTSTAAQHEKQVPPLANTAFKV